MSCYLSNVSSQSTSAQSTSPPLPFRFMSLCLPVDGCGFDVLRMHTLLQYVFYNAVWRSGWLPAALPRYLIAPVCRPAVSFVEHCVGCSSCWSHFPTAPCFPGMGLCLPGRPHRDTIGYNTGNVFAKPYINGIYWHFREDSTASRTGREHTTRRCKQTRLALYLYKYR